VTITLKDSTNSLSIITVYDVMGKMILQKKTIDTITSDTIDLSSVNPGIYFIEVQTENNTKVVKKLLVK
jgi:hypothetical protein